MTRYFLLLTSLILLAGCGKDKRLLEVQDLRKSSQPQEARAKALEFLREEPAIPGMWPEYVRCALEEARYLERRGEDPMEVVIQAALASAAAYRAARQNPSEDWRTAGLLCVNELARHTNRFTTTMRSQVRSAEYLASMRKMEGRDDSGGMKMFDAMNTVDGHRRDGRELLYQQTVVELLIGSLPETSPGAISQMLSQVTVAKTEWIQALELGADYTRPIIDRAQNNVTTALDKAVGDLNDLQYFLVESIVENGIL